MLTNAQSTPSQRLKDLNDSKENVSNYSKFGIEGTSLLAFRDVPALIQKYVSGKKTLDYGCGAGRSTRFLKSQGLDVIGVDISEKFLDACKEEAEIHYCKIENGKLPFIDNSYEFVFSSLVFLAIQSKHDIKTALREIHRVLKDTGILMIVTGSEKLHSPEMRWLSYETNFPENQNLSSGQVLKFHIRSADVTFYDYFWSNNDYISMFHDSQFQVLEAHFPLGRQNETEQWRSEIEYSPFVIYILSKSSIS